MRIAQVFPQPQPIPPDTHGGTARMVHYLTEELHLMGHEVTLFAPAGSRTAARLISPELSAGPVRRAPTLPVRLLEVVAAHAAEFDVIHWHLDSLADGAPPRLRTPQLHTLHGRLDQPEQQAVTRQFEDVPLVSVVNHQRTPLPEARWLGNVYYGLPQDLYQLQPTPGDYLVFLGALTATTRADRALELAREAGLPLRLAGAVAPADREYFERTLRPLLDEEAVYLGEVGDADKQVLLGGALALLLPDDQQAPCSLALLEAMACGTPAIAWRQGAVAELITDGISGFLVDSLESALGAIERARGITRAGVRDAFLGRHTARLMATQYVRLYEQLLDPPIIIDEVG